MSDLRPVVDELDTRLRLGWMRVEPGVWKVNDPDPGGGDYDVWVYDAITRILTGTLRETENEWDQEGYRIPMDSIQEADLFIWAQVECCDCTYLK